MNSKFLWGCIWMSFHWKDEDIRKHSTPLCKSQKCIATSKIIWPYCGSRIWWLGCWEDEWKFCGSRLQWMKGDVINETGELSMLPHYFMGMNKKLFLGPVGAAAAPFRHRRGVVVICSRLVVLHSLQRCVRAPARCLGLCRRRAATPRRCAACCRGFLSW